MSVPVSEDTNALVRRWWDLSPPDRDKEFWSTKQVAEHTRYTETRIRALADEGRLPTLWIFGRLYIHIPTLLSELYERQKNH